MPLPHPLPHLEPKSKLSSRPCPSLCPQPARALDRQTFPAYPAPALSLQFPKATQPTSLGAHQTRWVCEGPGMSWGTDACRNRTFIPGLSLWRQEGRQVYMVLAYRVYF